jgi:uridine phosphorylase
MTNSGIRGQMETFHLYHLAAMFRSPSKGESRRKDVSQGASPADFPNRPAIKAPNAGSSVTDTDKQPASSERPFTMRAGAVQMVYAARLTREWITPETVHELEHWAALGCLTGIISIPLKD